MMAQWQIYSGKFNSISNREQYLIIATGLIAIIFILYSLFLDAPFQRISKLDQQILQTQQNNNSNINSIQILEEALATDPNIALRKELLQYQTKLGEIDQQLLRLTSDLIDPVQMRYALIKLLKLQKGVKLLSFEVLAAQPMTKSQEATEQDNNSNSGDKLVQSADVQIENKPLRLYRHGIKVKLQGQYFQLSKYLTQLENLSWTFFWQEFDYQLKDYPISELEVEIYSLSTAEEFIGV
jgi:MSHA biogenesis protein MshJ